MQRAAGDYGSELLTLNVRKTMLIVNLHSNGHRFQRKTGIQQDRNRLRMNFSARTAILGLLLLVATSGLSLPEKCLAQRKYKGPDDEKVQEIATLAADFLKGLDTRRLDYNAINALAVLEFHKRYDAAIPEGIPLIDNTVQRIAELADEGSGQVLNNREMYFPAIALILLAEYDAKKYKKQIQIILDAMVNRQMDTGAYAYSHNPKNDTSQSQFVSLAFYVARQHRFSLDPKVVAKLLKFYVDYQADDGSWNYQAELNDTRSTGTNSIHSASLSSVYLLADLLRLQRRVKRMSTRRTV